jgi:xylulose-5-phosphate/fructose-6-phosphate phosphoketolase
MNRVPQTGASGLSLKRTLMDKPLVHKQYVRGHGVELPEIRNWNWGRS